MFKYLHTYILFLAIISCTGDSGGYLNEPVAPTPQYTLSVTAGPGGTVSSSGGVYAQGTPLSITATPNSGFTFNSWSNGSTVNPLSISLNSNITISASFVAIPPTYSVALTAGEGGSVSGGGSYQQGTQVTLSATPNTGYVFLNWSDGSTDQNRSISVSQNLTLTANFEIITYTLTINAGTGGFVSSSGGTYDYGAQVTLSATPSTGYVFSSWSDGSTEQSRTITISQNTTLTANFVETTTYTLTVNAGSGGSVSSSGGTYEHGAQVTLSATPNTGYNFVNWSDGSTDSSRTITISQNTTLTANFVQNTETTTPSYTLSVSATNGGSVNTSGGEYAQGTSVTITATANSGYTFTGWSGNATGTNNSLTITINGNTSVTANFQIITYTLIVNSGTGGSVSSSGGTYNSGQQVTITATPNTGYSFLSWSDGSTQQSRTITISQNTTLTANFVENSTSTGSTTTSYTLSVSATNGGSVNTSGGEFAQGTSVTITATANSGYTFTGWSGNATGTNNSLTITINGNTSVTANFEITTYTLTVNSGSGGFVSSSSLSSFPTTGGTYNYGSQVTLYATPNTGYEFSSWSDGSTQQSRIITMSQNTTLTANFEIITYTLTVNAGTGGSVSSSGGSYNSGQQVTITATPNTGYNFVNWSGDSSSNSSQITITMNSNTLVTANFEIITYTLTVNAGTGGSVSSSGGTYNSGTQVTLSATPNSGYVFSSWSDGSTDSSRTITISENLTLTANFEIGTYTLTVNAGTGGSVSSSGGSYNSGQQVTITATPNTGYNFVNWSDGSTDSSRTITMSENTTLTANFAEIITYTLAVNAGTGGSVSSSGGTYNPGQQVTITATPNTGYNFVNWSDGSTQQSRIITMSQNTTLTANFEIITYTLTVNAGTGGSVSSSGGTYNHGQQVTITATPNTGYNFDNWSGDSSSNSSQITVTMNSNTVVTANFEVSYIYLDSNGVTVKALPGASIGYQETLNGTVYTIVDRETLLDMANGTNSNSGVAAQLLCNPFCNWEYAVTSYITDMSYLFVENRGLNGDISSWDVSNVTNMEAMFYNTEATLPSSFNKPIGNWDVSNVTNMKWMFRNANSFNQNINSWDVSSVTNMEGMFRGGNIAAGVFTGSSSFNQPIGNWDVSSVTTMDEMFYVANNFNQSIGSWNTSSVTTMQYMFGGASSFNQPIGNWDVSNVTEMHGMFEETEFNQPIGNWNTSSVNRMDWMFYSNHSFNQPIGNWNVSNVTSMHRMFSDARGFNQDISSWNVSNVSDFSRMFYHAHSFNQDISSWNISSATQMDRMFMAARDFNQDLSGWDLSGVSTNGCLFFSDGTSSWESSKKPDASSCGG